MPRPTRTVAFVLLLAAASACTVPASQPESSSMSSSAPVSGFVTDVPGFERFIASKPTPAQLHARYPDVTLILPGQIATKEYRLNNSRYFAQLDGEGRVTGGKFQ